MLSDMVLPSRNREMTAAIPAVSIISLARRAQPPRVGSCDSARGGWGKLIPAMTDFRAGGTIMGLAGLTAVFGMGTGVTPPVWSPEKGPAGGEAGPGPSLRCGGSATHVTVAVSAINPCGITVPIAGRCLRAADGSGWSSCSAVRTGRLKRSPAVHARPIDLVVFQEPSQRLLLETSSWRGLRA